MNKSAILALLLALLLPFVGYFLAKHYSKDAAKMPRHYFVPDSVITKTEKGKIVTDTVWHKVKNVSLINQYGNRVSMDSLKGKIIVINTLFTRCAGICPKITQVMKRMQESFKKSDTLVQFVSFSVDPVYDSAHHLRKFGERFGADFNNWWFVTGNKEELYDFMLKELKANVADTTVTPEFVHTDMFFLIDKNQVVRGLYHSLDENNNTNEAAMGKLAGDIPLLMLEKDKQRPSVFRQYIPILPLILGGVACVFFVMAIMNKKRKKY